MFDAEYDNDTPRYAFSTVSHYVLFITTKSCPQQPFFVSNPFNLPHALWRDPTPILVFSLASRNKIQNAFLSYQHASNYLICMQVKGQAVSVDFRICIDPSACQNEEDDGSGPATKIKKKKI